MKTFAVSIAALFIWTACGDGNQPIIDREALVERNSPVVTAFDSLASLSVGAIVCFAHAAHCTAYANAAHPRHA